ncbi:MAG: DNA translocase FtsK 4TM domain-containing protein [Eubacteriales bacterium]|nr:DNA translocase FtsK 4TM domain-containing protein [Eubacteriales bacterium]
MRAEVLILLSFSAAVLLFLSNFHLCGVAGDFLRGVQLGIFGMAGFIAPLVLFVGTCFAMSNRGNRTASRKLIASVALFLILCSFAQLLFGQEPAEGKSVLAYYSLSAKSGFGGGLVGGLICAGLKRLLGTIGAFLVLAVLFIISVVVITERSFVGAVKKRGDAAYQYAREDMDRRRELHAERQEERRRLREERVRGVNLGSTDLSVRDMDEEPYDEEYEDEYYGDEYGEDEAPDTGGSDEGLDYEEPSAASASAGRGRERASAPSASPADVFTGNISLPPEFAAEDDEDTVPFDADTEVMQPYGGPEETAQSLVAQGISRLDDADRVFGNTAEERTAQNQTAENPAAEDMAAGTPAPDGARQPSSGLQITCESDGETNYDPSAPEEPIDPAATVKTVTGEDFAIPEEAKRVVTAGGKVIETDTEALQKKLESKRQAEKLAAVQAENTEAAVQQQIKEKEEAPKKEYVFPPVSLLKRGSRIVGSHSEKEYKETAIKLQQTLRNFGVGVTVTNISCGPSVTRYELHPEQGVKVSKIVGLADDIKLSLAAEDIRIEAPIPGKSAVGIEVPNKENNTVYLRDLLESDNFKNHPSRLAFAVGKDIGGQVVVTDIAKMPHLLIAGATGSGKSVCINTLIMSIIYKSKPEDVKLIMVDPKVVELSVYNGIPHLLIPVVTDPKKASGALNWAVAEMTDRYKKFAEYNVRDLKGYNAKIENIKDIDDDKKPSRLPQIVIIVDELADLMMVSPGEVEDSICRLAQLARAAGIHLVIATQRPSVNVITGLIKANVPSRIAFSVSSGVDSRTIIDMNGAEKLLGKGDMLFYPAGFPKPQRVQGAFVSDQEVQQVVDFLTEQGMTSQYSAEVESQMNASPAAAGAAGGGKSGRDEYFEQAGMFIIEKEKASIGMLQRMFKIGFNRAARIMDQLAEAGVVGEEEGTKPRKVLMTQEEFRDFLDQEN